MTEEFTPRPDDPISVDDFKSIRLEVTLVNLTTNTEITAGPKKVSPESSRIRNDEGVQFVEFLDNGMVLAVPPHSGAKGHKLLVKIKTLGTKNEINVEARAKIMGVEALNGGKSFRVDLEMEDHDTIGWTQLMDLYGNRQNEIEEFFQAVRGY